MHLKGAAAGCLWCSAPMDQEQPCCGTSLHPGEINGSVWEAAAHCCPPDWDAVTALNTRYRVLSAAPRDEKCIFLPLKERSFSPTPFFSAVLCAAVLNLLPITEDYLKKTKLKFVMPFSIVYHRWANTLLGWMEEMHQVNVSFSCQGFLAQIS